MVAALVLVLNSSSVLSVSSWFELDVCVFGSLGVLMFDPPHVSFCG